MLRGGGSRFRAAAGAERPFGSLLLGPVDEGSRRLRLRIQLLLTVMLVGTNLVGALVVAVMSTVVVPGEAPTAASLRILAIAVPVYVVVAVVLGGVVGTRRVLGQLLWVRDDRPPTPAERETALRVPWRLTRVQASLWAFATVLFTLLAVLVQPGRALATGFTVGIAGLVVGAIAYLLAEFALRPVAARALAVEESLEQQGVGIQVRMVVFWGLGTAAPVLGLMVTALLALTQGDVSRDRLAVVVLALGAVVLVFGLLVTTLAARAVTSPLGSLRTALRRVEEGDFGAQVPVYDGTEVGLLQTGFNQMVRGLSEREHLRDLFGRQVGREVAAAAALGEVELGGEAREVSVLFVDLVGSTAYAVDHAPAEVVALLNRFFAVVVSEVDAHHGLVNKFMGDAVLAVFGAPVELDGHATEALAAARAMAVRLADEVPEIGFGIGVATGEAVAGNVGDETRYEYTVIGDVVNSAARITELAKDTDAGLLAAWPSVSDASDEEQACWSRASGTTLRGRTEETELAAPRP